MLFDRVCSVETSSKLKEIFTENVEEGYVLKETKVAANKMGPWSDISGEEPVSVIAVLSINAIFRFGEDRFPET